MNQSLVMRPLLLAAGLAAMAYAGIGLQPPLQLDYSSQDCSTRW